MERDYDFLIVGSGLFGAVFAREMHKTGKKCLVIEKREHIGGNLYCESREGINIHMYGPHIFHTNDRTIWEYVNSIVEFNRFTYSPLASFEGKLYNLPFNMNTFYQLWNVTTPESAEKIINDQIKESGIAIPRNLEEQAISLVGADVYRILIKGYTEKQWGRSARDLPNFIIKRLPVRFNYDNNYFNDRYQGIPVGGYNKLIEGLLNGIEVITNANFFQHREELSARAEYMLFTGPIDEFYDYRFGPLAWRSLRFEHETLDTKNYQGVAVVNYTASDIPFTRIIEHKHFEFGDQQTTVITREYPEDWTVGKCPYYPINDEQNNQKWRRYKELADQEKKVLFGGRLAQYKYYDMHQIIGSSLKLANAALQLFQS